MIRFKNISLWFVFVFLILNILLVSTGNSHLYKGLSLTYLKGKSGPTIYDQDYFPSDTVFKSKNEFSFFKNKENYNLPKPFITYLDSLETSSFIIVKNDSIVSENYFGKHQESTLSNSFSAAKSITSLLIGIAVKKGYIESIDDSISKYIPEWKYEPRGNVTIRNVLQMSSGLKWIESQKNPFSDNAKAYYGNNLNQLIESTMTVDSEQGEKHDYKSGNTQILAMIIENSSNMSLDVFTGRFLWSKIGCSMNGVWNKDREEGNIKSYCCFYANSMDLAKIGRLVLQNGRWNNEQLIDNKYFKEMISPANYSKDSANYYGLHWWLIPEENVVYARGIQGQYIIVDYNNNSIIVRTGSKRIDPINGVGHPQEITRYISEAKKISN
jgi:CubicO group peptidase (beta-lactamase class C family)